MSRCTRVVKLFFENSLTDEGDGRIFSGFSVGFCINEEKVICYQLELGK